MCFSVMVENDLKKLEKMYQAHINPEAFDYFTKHIESHPEIYKPMQEPRIFAKGWAPVIVTVKGHREIRPMRYQLLPHFCELPKYTRENPKTGRQVEVKSTYNARLDSLSTAHAWRKPFMNYHAILPIKSFYEWVQHQGKPTQIEFFDPEKSEPLHIPCLYDNWYSQDKSLIIQSFAIITTEPTSEVQAKGHDRSPINIPLDKVEIWLEPEKSNREEIFEILSQPLPNKFDSRYLTA